MENIPALLNCRCGGTAEMQTSINFCWVECLECQRTGTSATDYPTAANNWNTQEAKMENIPARNMNPPESNAPDCHQCGKQKNVKYLIGNKRVFYCDNPRCEYFEGDKDDRIEQLLTMLDAMEKQRNANIAEKQTLMRDNFTQGEEIKRLREALEFYADKQNWRSGLRYSNGDAILFVDADGYTIARRALDGPQ